MAFYKCLSLTEIVIPEGVKKIGNSAFEDCIRLKKVYFEGAIPKCGANIFAGCRELTLNAEIFFTSHKLNVSLVSAFPKENSKAVAYIQLYQNGKKWNDFADSVAKDHAEEIAEEIFTLLQNSKKVEGDVGMKAAMFIVRWRDNIKLEQIKKIYSLLQKNNCTEAIKTLDADDEKAQEAENISKQESIQEVSLEDSKNEGTFSDKSLAGLTFVVTGNVNTFSSRSELKKFIEERGGKLTGSVSSQTNYLITNTPNSGTSKNRAAQDLGVEIITEEQFRKMVKG
jgi:NAD-dependent DNA ligase